MKKKVIKLINGVDSINSATLESYKTLRTNLLYTEDSNVIALTSSAPEEGKSFSSYNLALSLAQMDKKVLLIDADLRKGSLRKYFNINKDVAGLSEALSGQTGDILYPTEVSKLFVVFSGKIPPNPTELLASKRFESILKQFRESFDYIVIDTPPLSASIDAAIVGRQCDGVVLVIRNDFAKKKNVKRTKKELERNGSRIIGAVLNRVKKDQVDFKNYNYNYYYEEK